MVKDEKEIFMVFFGRITKEVIVIYDDGEKEDMNLNDLMNSELLNTQQKNSIMNSWKTTQTLGIYPN